MVETIRPRLGRRDESKVTGLWDGRGWMSRRVLVLVLVLVLLRIGRRAKRYSEACCAIQWPCIKTEIQVRRWMKGREGIG